MLQINDSPFSLDTEILRLVGQGNGPARFATELQHAVRPWPDDQAFAAALERLAERGDIIIVTKTAPDPHLADADLRIVARASAGAAEAVETTWRDWLREFLASHRCS